MSTKHLLIEVGTEELPPVALKPLSTAFSQALVNALLEADLVSAEDAAEAEPFASPRRLALLVPKVASAQPDQSEQRRGPAVAAAFNEQGEPTPAALGFARSCGLEVADLDRLKTDKGEWLSATVHQAGQSLSQLITPILETAIKSLPIPKRMRWGNGSAEFVRPAHWLVVMHGDECIPAQLLGLTSSNITRGHRFHSNGDLCITSAAQYEELLADKGSVMASFAARQAEISRQLQALATEHNAQLDDDQALLDEVTGLVEKPVALIGSFDEDFLQVPAECLISAMRDHQKYFHLRDANGRLLPKFITLSNIQSKDAARVVDGNERVLRARLSDARFFWDTDRKQPLSEKTSKLDSILFHIELGSLAQKTRRLEKLAQAVAGLMQADQSVVQRAAHLAKADLVTNMVGEFDKLQGLMGHYYADLDGEPALVGEAIEQHYWPRYAGDTLPASAEAQALAVADRLDSLVGIYAAGEIPTGDKDPYSLRRASLGILRILIEKQQALGLAELVAMTADIYAEQGFAVAAQTQSDIVAFIEGRLTAYYQGQGVATNTINAVLECHPDQPLDFAQRLAAVQNFKQLEAADDLAAANKRISNILKKQAVELDAAVQESLLKEADELALFKALQQLEPEVDAAFNTGDYSAGLSALASLRGPVDAFFENVMVMSEIETERNNRLALLARIRNHFLRVADIAQLQS